MAEQATEWAGARALCIAIHDVAPATWPACLRLHEAVRAVAELPLTWLVVPRYHQNLEGTVPALGRRDSAVQHVAGAAACEAGLEAQLARGHELALHGYTHRDTAPPASGLRERLLRTVLTESEGEFAAIDAHEAGRRIELGLEWFAQRHWPVSGFVAPAWLLGAGAWTALRRHRFAYTTTLTRLHLLHPRHPRHPPHPPHAVFAPSLMYAARNGPGRLVSPPLADALARLYRHAPLLRLALHPRDALHPALLRHAQQLIAHLLLTRTALTKDAAARRYQ